MADPTAPEHPEQPARSKIGEGLREGRKLGQWFLNLRPDQIQSAALIGMTAFLVMLVAWIVYRSDTSREKDKDRETAARESMTRECNTQGELLRQSNSIEIDKTRAATAQLAKDVQANQKDMLSMLMTHQSVEREKDRAHDIERDREHLRTIKEIRDAWAAFAVRIGDLDRFLRKKDPPEEDNDGVKWLGLPTPRLKFNVPQIERCPK